MSYDLYFTPPYPIPVAALTRHFEGRAHTELMGDGADYDNPDTGVHFQWWFGDPESGEDANDPLRGAQVTLSLNYNRPTPFVYEAAREAEAITNAFDMKAIDPQTDMQHADFQAARFIADYIRETERVTARLIADVKAEQPPTMPRADLMRIWTWNDQRDMTYDQLGTDLFVPKIMLFEHDDKVRTAVIWGDGVPMCCPLVDFVLCLRRDTAPTTGFFRKQKQDLMEALSFADFLNDFGDVFHPRSGPDQSWACESTDKPTLEDRLRDRTAAKARPINVWRESSGLTNLHFSTVFDTEFFATAGQG